MCDDVQIDNKRFSVWKAVCVEEILPVRLFRTFHFSTVHASDVSMFFLVFRVVDDSAEQLGSRCVVFDVEQEGSVGDEFTRFTAELVDQFDFSCRPCGGS